MNLNPYLDVAPEVAAAVAAGKPVVALESTIISHGMPYPQNVETALKVEQIIRDNGAVPATIAILGGRLKAGLTAEEIEYLGKKGQDVTKASRREADLQSRIHCTRLAGQKADNWWLRQSPQVMGLQFVDGLGRADRDNAIDVYMGDEYEDVLRDGEWQKRFKVKPEVFTAEEKKAWLAGNQNVTLGSDAFFPFSDNIERAKKSGVAYIAQPGGSVRDDLVIEACDKYGMVMVFTGIRLFHH